MSSDGPFTTGQAAEYCHVTQATIINWIKDKKLSGYTTPGGHYRIPRSDLVSFLKSHDMPIDEALREPAQKRLLVLSNNPAIRDLAQALGKNGSPEVSVVTDDYAASAEAARSKPDAVIIDIDTSSDPLGLCRWLRKTVEETALLVVGDERGKAIAEAVGADICHGPQDPPGDHALAHVTPSVGPEALPSLEAKLEELLR
jgi:excisionase family DNA binding protein